jgi:hypothetical protein
VCTAVNHQNVADIVISQRTSGLNPVGLKRSDRACQALVFFFYFRSTSDNQRLGFECLADADDVMRLN